jgi:hypothetical protein
VSITRLAKLSKLVDSLRKMPGYTGYSIGEFLVDYGNGRKEFCFSADVFIAGGVVQHYGDSEIDSLSKCIKEIIKPEMEGYRKEFAELITEEVKSC